MRGRQDHGAVDLALGAGALHLGLEHGDRRLHGLAGEDQLGQEHVLEAELTADVVDAGHEPVIDGLERVQAGLDGLPSEICGRVGLALDDAPRHGLEQVLTLHG